jgi:hypothetical protein
MAEKLDKPQNRLRGSKEKIASVGYRTLARRLVTVLTELLFLNSGVTAFLPLVLKQWSTVSFLQRRTEHCTYLTIKWKAFVGAA